MISQPPESPTRRFLAAAGTVACGLADIIWPPHCLVCGALHTRPLCIRCAAQIEKIAPPVCRVCGVPMDDVGTCRWCADTSHSFRAARAVAAYAGVMERAVRQLKFSGRRSLAPVLGEMMAELAQSSKVLANRNFDCVVPVPMHPANVLEREFNQSELLARDLADRIGIACESALLRKVRKTRPQVGLSAQMRRDNLDGAFAVVPDASLAGKSILLVDDVMTTGATADECAKTLLAAGASSVHVITAAREV